MSILVRSVVALLALTITLTASYAKTVTFNISGTHTRAEIGAKCTAGGGIPYNTKGKKGKFGCDNLNTGKSVDCNSSGKCTATVPQ
jgi:hypothetical protein